MRRVSIGLLSGVFTITTFFAVASPSWAITRRTDVSDTEYIDYALSEFPFTGSIIGSYLGSGTLISPNWVLTAEHVARSAMGFNFTTPDGTQRQIVEIVKHPSLDLALVRLNSDINNIEPAKLYSLDYGIDYARECFVAGAGMSGTGITGQQNGSQTPCRAGQQYALYHGDRWGGMWTKDMILTQFRSPSRGGKAMEGGSAQGDSGGGLFFQVEDEYCLAGTMSLVWVNDGGNYGRYDHTGGAYINTAQYNDWITSYATNAMIISEVPEPTTCVLLLGGLATLLVWRRKK